MTYLTLTLCDTATLGICLAALTLASLSAGMLLAEWIVAPGWRALEVCGEWIADRMV